MTDALAAMAYLAVGVGLSAWLGRSLRRAQAEERDTQRRLRLVDQEFRRRDRATRPNRSA